MGQFEQIIEASEPISTGHAVFSASFEKKGDTMPTQGTVDRLNPPNHSGSEWCRLVPTPRTLP